MRFVAFALLGWLQPARCLRVPPAGGGVTTLVELDDSLQDAADAAQEEAMWLRAEFDNSVDAAVAEALARDADLYDKPYLKSDITHEFASRKELASRPKEGGAVINIYDALRKLTDRTAAGPVCMAARGELMGRLSNAVSMLNMVARTAVNASLRFHKHIAYKFPHKYSRYMIQDGFGHIFGDDRVCPNQNTKVYMARCPASDQLKRCFIPKMLVDTAAPVSHRSDLCNCGQVVLVPTEEMFWDHQYEFTRDIFRRRYWRAHPARITAPGSGVMIPGGFPKQAVMHVRLGDVEDTRKCLLRFTPYNCNKRLKASYYPATVRAMMDVLPAHCFDLHVVTDGRPDSHDIVQIMANLTQMGAKPRLWTSESLDTKTTFHFMTHADILLYGTSGFGQFAAVLTKNATARIGTPQAQEHPAEPFFFMSNTSQMREDKELFDMKTGVEQVRKNTALQAFANECRRHRAFF